MVAFASMKIELSSLKVISIFVSSVLFLISFSKASTIELKASETTLR